MPSFRLVLVVVLVLAIFCGAPAHARDLRDHPLVRSDPAAGAIVDRLLAATPGAAIEVLGKHRVVDSTTAATYTLLKLRVDGENRTCALNEMSGAFALDAGLPAREAALLLAMLPPVYAKMAPAVLGAIRAEQGGILGGPTLGTTPLDVRFHTDSAAGLGAIESALDGVPARRFDSELVRVTPPPGGSVPPMPGMWTISASVPAAEVLRVGAADVVTHIDMPLLATPLLDVSLPRINVNVLKGYGLQGLDVDVAIVDTGIDGSHPNLVTTHEADFTGGSHFCQFGPTPNLICMCAGGACVAGTCDDGPNVTQACVPGCGTGICSEFDDGYPGSHGTHVAGIVSNNSNQFEGVARHARLINAKAIPGFDIEGALSFARTRGAEIVNGSFSAKGRCDLRLAGDGACHVCREPAASIGNLCLVNADCGVGGVCTTPTSTGTSPTSIASDHEVFAHNLTVVISAEERPYNGRCSNDHTVPCVDAVPCPPQGSCRAFPSFPNDGFNVITVGASEVRGPPPGTSTIADFTMEGPTSDGRSKPDVLAPGDAFGVDDIDSTRHDWEGPGVDFVDKKGTSMAAPHVAGLAALLWSFGHKVGILTDTPTIKAAILNNARQLAGWTRPSDTQPLDTQQGIGEVDALATFDAYADDLRIWQQEVTGVTRDDKHWYSIDVEAQPAEIVATLVFERHPDSAVEFGPVLSDLDLALYDPDGVEIARSQSDVDSVEHIFHAVTANGRYCLEVDPHTLSPGPTELYALAARVTTSAFARLQFHDIFNPCRPDFGDAPDPAYPTLRTSNGARHLDWTKEWLGGSRAEFPGELRKQDRTVASFVDPAPSVSGERNANDPTDEDGTSNLVDRDGFDDGVSFQGPIIPKISSLIEITVQTTVDDTGVGHLGRYRQGAPTARLYVNGWADWNGDGDWDDAGEKIVGTGSPTGTYPIDPETFGPNGRYTLGETFNDDNASGRWEPNEIFTDTVGATEVTFPLVLLPPPGTRGTFYMRFRLDYGEDVGNLRNVSGTLAESRGAAQHGEVEDYRVRVLDHFQCFETHRPPMNREGVELVDQFGPSTVTVERPKRLCAPADKNGEDPAAVDDPAHLTAYDIKQTSPHFKRVRGVIVTNQFGEQVFDLITPERLLVPTAKSLSGTPDLLDDPIDHFKCYRVSGDRFRRRGLTVATQFDTMKVDIKRPLHLCAPVNKNDEGILDPTAFLMCYHARGPRPYTGDVFTKNQLGTDDFAVFGSRELCVPSAVTR